MSLVRTSVRRIGIASESLASVEQRALVAGSAPVHRSHRASSKFGDRPLHLLVLLRWLIDTLRGPRDGRKTIHATR